MGYRSKNGRRLENRLHARIMAGPRRREELTPDGVVTSFTTQATYVPGTVFVFWNGQLQEKEFVTELGGTSFEICEIVDADESLQVDYQPLVVC